MFVTLGPEGLLKLYHQLWVLFEIPYSEDGPSFAGTAKNGCDSFNLCGLVKWTSSWTLRQKTQRCDD